MVNVVDKSGKTALDYATENDSKSLVRTLLKHGAMVAAAENVEKCKFLIVPYRTMAFKVIAGSIFGAGALLVSSFFIFVGLFTIAMGYFIPQFIIPPFIILPATEALIYYLPGGGDCYFPYDVEQLESDKK